MPSPSSSLSLNPPTLPYELIDQIARHSTLSKRDLANSCLVNHHFLETIQPLLFREVSLWLIWKDVSKRGRIKDQPRSLLRTLQNSPSLQQHVRKLNLSISYVLAARDEDGMEYYSGFADCEEILDEALKVMPRVDSLFVDDGIWESELGRNAVLSRGVRWKELSIRGDLFGQDADSTWVRFPNLKKLLCHAPGPQQTSEQAIPNNLEVLGTSFGLHLMEPVKVSPGCKLRVLRVVLTENALDYLGLMQQLEHLHLATAPSTGSPSSTTFENLSRLPSLRSLSIRSIEPESDEVTNIQSLLNYLPPSLTRLDFLDYVPLDFLTTLFETNKLSHIRVVRLGKRYEYEGSTTPLADYKLGMDRIREVCEEKGVALEEHIVPQTHLAGMLSCLYTNS
ncbi:hypothetical protein JCM5353_002627 [Sporobolomyces roseus]